MNRIVLFGVVASAGCVAFAAAADRSVVFNHLTGPPTDIDKKIHEHFSGSYEVVDFTDRDHTYTHPKSLSGFGPPPPVYANNRCVTGNALIAFVVTLDGHAASPYVLTSTSPALEPVALQIMTRWRFEAGTLDGKSVATMTVARFHTSPCPQ